MNQPLSNSQTRDAEALLHTYVNPVALRRTGVQTIERGEGIRVFDQAGRPFIEAMSGLWCAGLGFGNSELAEAARVQMEKLPYYHLFGGKSHEPAVELAERIKALTPGRMSRVIFQSSGSEANETQVKLAWYYNNARGRPEKKKIISRIRGYHGVTIVAGSHDRPALQPPRFRPARRPHPPRRHAPSLERRRARRERTRLRRPPRRRSLEDLILREGPDTVAAFIAEPVMGAGGVIIPPEGYFPAIAEVCRRHDILMIADEVICGFGRTGQWFGSQTLGYEPDTISMAKQLTGGFLPLSAVAVNADIAETVETHAAEIGTFGHGFTYGGHPVAAAVGIRALDIYERDDIPGHVRAVAPRFAAHIDRLAAHPLVGEGRRMGLLGAFELAPDRSPKGSPRPARSARSSRTSCSRAASSAAPSATRWRSARR